MSTRRLEVILILALFGSALGLALPQANQNGAVEITLTDATTSKPISGGTLVLQGPMIPVSTRTTQARVPPPSERTETTDKDGRAAFRNLSPGQYSVRAQKNGYVGPSQSGIGFPAFAAIGVLIASDQSPQSLRLTLTRGATISGTITDTNGAPVAGMRISAGMIVYQNGRRMLVARSGAQTDDRGTYRLFWFGPGEYHVYGDAPIGLLQSANYARTFYPGTIDFAKSKPLTITGGEELTQIDIILPKVTTYRVTGKILNLPAPPSGVVSLIPSFSYVSRDLNAVDMPGFMIPNRTRSSGGEFEIAGIPPGSWNLFAILPQSALPGNMPRYMAGRVPIDITDKDIQGVTIRLSSVDVKGQVVMPKSPNALPAGLSMQNIRVSLQPAEPMPQALMPAGMPQPLEPNGDFEFHGVPSGKYFVGLSTQVSIDDIRVGSRSIFDDGIITVGPAPPDRIRIIISRESTGVSGTVLGIAPETTVAELSSTRVVLAPAPPRRQNRTLYRTSSVSNLNGSFFFFSVSPGNYQVFAIEGLPQGAELDPEVLARYEDRGRPITVAAGSYAANRVQVEWIRKTK